MASQFLQAIVGMGHLQWDSTQPRRRRPDTEPWALMTQWVLVPPRLSGSLHRGSCSRGQSAPPPTDLLGERWGAVWGGMEG